MRSPMSSTKPRSWSPQSMAGILVDARLPVDDLGDLFDVEFPDHEWDTVGGLVLALAGRVPKEGEQFEHDGVLFTADRVQGRRVARVLCRRT